MYIEYMYQNILQRHLGLGEQRTLSNLEAKEYLIHSGTINSTFEFRSKFKQVLFGRKERSSLAS